jgi:hypothetical protein
VACDVNASIDWARLSVRGRPSNVMAVAPAEASQVRTAGAAARPSSPSRI